jgi:hypothetical protein
MRSYALRRRCNASLNRFHDPTLEGQQGALHHREYPERAPRECSVMKSRCTNVTVDLETPIISFVDLFRQKPPLTTLLYIKDRSNPGFHRVCRYDALDLITLKLEAVSFEKGDHTEHFSLGSD